MNSDARKIYWSGSGSKTRDYTPDINNWPRERDVSKRGTAHNYTIKGLLMYDILLSWKSLTNARGLPNEWGRDDDRCSGDRGGRFEGSLGGKVGDGEGVEYHRRRTDE